MTEEKIKSTHKIKKKSQGGFYSEFASYNPKGKSFAQIMLMIEDLRKNVAFQLTRISKLKYVLILEKEKHSEKVRKIRATLSRRNLRIESLLETVSSLRKDIKKLKVIITNEERKVSYRDKKIKKLERELSKKPVEVIVEVERKPTIKEQSAMRAAQTPINPSVAQLAGTLYKTEMFLRKEGMTIKQIGLLVQTDATNGFYLSEVEYDKAIVARLEDKGFISSDFVGIKDNRKFYSITPKGKEKVKKYRDWISYSKNYI